MDTARLDRLTAAMKKDGFDAIFIAAPKNVQYISGIEMPSLQMSGLRTALMNCIAMLEGDVRVLVVGCDNAANVEALRSQSVAVFSLPCIAMLPPSFIEYALREGRVDGVFITGCRDGDCLHRLGVAWTDERLATVREPRLRSRVERVRIKEYWAASSDLDQLVKELKIFQMALSALPQTR